jgi:hypothetical protein
VLQPRCTIAAVPSLPSTHASAARLAIEATCTEGGGGGGGGGQFLSVCILPMPSHRAHSLFKINI